MSWPLTWVNYVISSSGIYFLWIYKAIRLGSFTKRGSLSDTFFAIPCLIINFFTLLLLQLTPKCKAFCCQCCQTHCYPVHQLTALDPDDPFELIEWPLPEPEENIELQVIKRTSNVQGEANILDQTRNNTNLSMLPIEGNFKCVHCGKVNQLKELIEWPLPETNIELQVIQSSFSIPNDIENEKTRKMSETKNDIKLPVLPRFPDITACK